MTDILSTIPTEATHEVMAIWRPEDIKHEAFGRGIELSDEEAEEILFNVEEELQDEMIMKGWDVIGRYFDRRYAGERYADRVRVNV